MAKTNRKNTTIWGASLLYSDDYYLMNEFDHISNSDSKVAFSLNIFMDNGFVYYTRPYKKILLIISDVFPLFKLLLYFMKKFTQHVKMSSTKRRLVGLIFENKEEKIIPIQFVNKIKEINKNNNHYK